MVPNLEELILTNNYITELVCCSTLLPPLTASGRPERARQPQEAGENLVRRQQIE